ncbi:interferon gamma receptor 1-like [Carassius gibelio]|uniref:interferon gamma receptor 1-like n=1 Tax=Carassius gibelio TaxID=101364 RepID=UPI002278ACDD|nr:interferon gamma receptor 1-like [Carassius gibelio]
MRIQIYISVTVLILTYKSASEAVSRPSPPASVSIQCDSYGVEVRWEYPDLDQDVQFQVKVIHDYNERNSNITQKLTRSLHLNISSMLFHPAFNRYIVTVTALRGGEESEPTPSDIFSYNKYATANIKCYLDFPEVKLSPKDGKLHVQFINPLQLYRNSPALRGLTDNLQYCIETEERNETCQTCEINQNTCETSIVFSENRGEYCVNLTGKIRQRFFNLRSSCFTGDYPPITVYVYPVLGVVLTLLFMTAIIMLLVTKCNSEIKKKILLMSPNVFDFGETKGDKCRTLKVEPEPCSAVKIEPAKNTKEQDLLLKIGDEEWSSSSKDLSSADSEVKNPYGPNDLVGSEQSDLSNFYDCPHSPR